MGLHEVRRETDKVEERLFARGKNQVMLNFFTILVGRFLNCLRIIQILSLKM